ARAPAELADWPRAPAYFAASRVHHDSVEARWGSALARSRMPRRFAVLARPAGMIPAVGFAPDGRAIAVVRAGDRVEGRDVRTGALLWSVRGAVDSNLHTVLQPAPGGPRVLLLDGGDVRL